MRLRTLSFILLIMIALIPSLVLSVVIYQKVYHLAENGVEQKLDRVAKQINADVIHQVELLSIGLELLSEQKLMSLGIDNLFYARQVYDALNHFGENNPLIESLYLISEDGFVVESYAGDIIALEDSEIIKLDQYQKSMMYSSKLATEQFMATSWVEYFNNAELLEKENETDGIAFIIPISSSVKLDSVDIYGYLIAIMPISKIIALADVVKNPQELVNISLQGKLIDGDIIDEASDDVIKSSRIAITSNGFKNILWLDLKVAQSSEEIRDNIYTVLSPVLTTGAVILVLLLLISLVVARLFSHTFNQLNRLIQSFKLGGSIYSKPFFILEFRDLNKLLGRLQKTINQQIQKLSDKNSELANIDKLREKYLLEVQTLNTGLEQQVESRTQELALTLVKVEHGHFVFQQLIKFRRELESSDSNRAVARIMLDSIKICLPNISIALFLPEQIKHRTVFQNINIEFLDPCLLNEQFLADENRVVVDKKITVQTEVLHLTSFSVSKNKYGWLVIKDREDSPEKNSWLTLFIAEINSYLMMRSLNENLDRAASTDSLTGLKNRKAFDQYLAMLQSQTDSKAGLYVIDVNGLKGVNDNQGHEQGDLLIINAVKTLSHCAKNISEHVFRIGGDEFAIILAGNELKQVDKLTDNLIQQQLFSRSDSSAVSFSFGYDSTENCKFDMLYKAADRNMYKDKETFYRRRKEDR